MKKLLPLLVIGLFIVIGYFYSDFTQSEKEEINLGLASKCDPQKNVCQVNLNNIGLSLYLPSGMHPLKQFNILVTSTGIAPSETLKTTVDFKMSGMNMGLNQFILKRESGNKYVGEAILPVCVSGRRDWRATVRLATSETIYRGIFNIKAQK